MARRQPIRWPAEDTAEFDYVDYLSIAEELSRDTPDYEETSDDDQRD